MIKNMGKGAGGGSMNKTSDSSLETRHTPHGGHSFGAAQTQRRSFLSRVGKLLGFSKENAKDSQIQDEESVKKTDLISTLQQEDSSVSSITSATSHAPSFTSAESSTSTPVSTSTPIPTPSPVSTSSPSVHAPASTPKDTTTVTELPGVSTVTAPRSSNIAYPSYSPEINKKSLVPIGLQMIKVLEHLFQEQLSGQIILQDKSILLPAGTRWKGDKTFESIVLQKIASEYSRSNLKYSGFRVTCGCADVGFGQTINGVYKFDFGVSTEYDEKRFRELLQFLTDNVLPNLIVPPPPLSPDTVESFLGLRDTELFTINPEGDTYSVHMPVSVNSDLLEKVVLDTLFDAYGQSSYGKAYPFYRVRGTDEYDGSGYFNIEFQLPNSDITEKMRFRSLKRDSSDLIISFGAKSFLANKDFLIDFTSKFLKKIRATNAKGSTNSKDVALQKLTSIGVKVSIPDLESTRDINALREKYGFIGRDELFAVLEQDIVDPLKNPEKYKQYQERFSHLQLIPNAALMYGPPGNGKTTFAQIVGDYIGCPFVYIPVATLLSKWHGESENNFNTTFQEAGVLAQSYGRVIVMIDEIDEVGGDRAKKQSSHGTEERITGILLKKLEGIEKIQNMFFFGATNRMDTLDPALISRFQSKIEFGNPSPSDAKKILSHYLSMDMSILDDSVVSDVSGRFLRDASNSVIRSFAKSETSIELLNPDLIIPVLTTKLRAMKRISSETK